MHNSAMGDVQEPWHLTIVLLEGLRLMRPEKAWRPIVTVEVDKHHSHETTLGVDGQNVNQKDVFKFHDAKPSSQVEIKVWHRSQSKKKKGKILVASACHSLGELLKKQELEPRLEIRLQCRSADQKCGASRGRPQNKALLRLKVKPPPVAPKMETPVIELEEDEYGSDVDISAAESSCSSTDPLDFGDPPDPIPHPYQNLRRRRVRGYAINSDEEPYSTDGSEIQETRPLYSVGGNSFARLHEDDTCVDDEDTIQDEKDDPYSKALVYRSGSGEIIAICPEDGEGWMAASDLPLPLYTEKITVPPNLSKPEKILASMTMYGELASAETTDQFEAVFQRLQQEWTFIGGLLVALAAVNTAVFSISPGSIFTVDTYARSAVATSSVASGLGIACDAWFLLRYNWADIHTFISRARDLYESYFFFSLSARVPAFCMFISAVSLMGFLALVAFDAWPRGVLFVCFVVGIVMSLQFLVYGVHWCGKRVAMGGRASGRGVVRVVRVVRSMTG